jgi:hypothetical protein
MEDYPIILPDGFSYHYDKYRYHVVTHFYDKEELFYVVKYYGRYKQWWHYEVISQWQYFEIIVKSKTYKK